MVLAADEKSALERERASAIDRPGPGESAGPIDYCQLGEILNNLGCLSYMCGQPSKAMKLFREALDVQLAVLNSTLYGGSKYSAHSATLNISITRGNIGFLALVLKDVSSGIVALESALRVSR